ncbi:general odorant-binding protein 45-like [Aedes aegypti]|uniref:Uncharacterized protein n=1 Tax=Aedes aegypti TaxID=7159 RepID=A0A6I8TY69_AEDAE|nr:general odorant-binding protein 45-like [Aedes aegypti]
MFRIGLIFASFAVVSIIAVDRHKIVYKSLQEAAVECGQYTIKGQCLGRCETLITRDWNDTTGMSPAYSRFFQPDPVDECNLNRTQRCLQTKVYTVPRPRTCQRASESIQCYLDQFGQVNLTTPQFIRFTPLQDDQIVLECAAIMGYTYEQVYAWIRESAFQRPETRCIYRCFLIRSGLYSDSEGLNMARFYVLCGGYEEDFYQRVEQCAARLRQEVPCNDKCTLAQRLAIECIGADYQAGNLATNTNSKAVEGSRVQNINLNARDSSITASNVESGNIITISRTDSDTYVYGDTNYFDNYFEA